MQKQKQDLVAAVKALGIDPVSLAEFLKVHIEVSEAVKNLTEGYNPETERAINQAKLLTYLL